ncbi:MAG: hypothetical protein ACRDYA_14240 [Egibacteraceae bacterium]
MAFYPNTLLCSTGQDDVSLEFSLSAGMAHEAVECALALDRICLGGVHCHIGSQITSTDSFDAAAGPMLFFLADLWHIYGIQPEELNLGGGFGITYLEADVAHDRGVRGRTASGCAQWCCSPRFDCAKDLRRARSIAPGGRHDLHRRHDQAHFRRAHT